jgi:beta-N-acetylhexosaminidase
MHDNTSGENDRISRRRPDRVRGTSSGALAGARIAAAVLALVVVAGASSAGAPAAGTPLATLVGARLVVGIDGTSPSPALLERIRQGRVGGVILMGANVRSAPQVRELTARLRGAAEAGGRRLLIMTDQEGGEVRRFRWAPPAASAETLGRRTEGAIRRTGRSTARALERLGVDVDLAPVADVPGVPDSFIAATDRGFSANPTRAAKGVTAFAAGLLDGGVAPTLKHFPGLGLATTSTDDAAVRITASEEALQPGFVPYRRAIAAGVVPLVMVSNAAYTAFGGQIAAWSPRVLSTLTGLGFTGVTITDALEPLARTHHVTLGQAALRAARAGVDLLLFVGSERSTDAVYGQLLAAARDGRLPRAALEASAARIDELAATYAG